MSNDILKLHKATYLIQRFIDSEYFDECNLTAYEISLLFIIARYLDMPEKKCFIRQDKLCKKAGMSCAQLKRALKILSEKNLIIVYSSWRNNGYELGGYFNPDEKIS